MTLRNIFLLLLVIAIPTLLPAQHRKVKAKKKKVEAPVENPRFKAMLSSTADIMIVDSLVVDSATILDAVFPNPEEGRLYRYSQFFNQRGDGIVYVNELGNKCIYSKYDEDMKQRYLFQSDRLADGWTAGEPLPGIDDDGQLHDFDYPYLMPDGVTLYFAAKGGEGLGGYDIYRTRFDNDEGRWLRPENMALPFNSEADDCMYVIDEQNQLAWFASSRRQPQGKTCVYTFVPTESRKLFNGDDATTRSRANIEHIADTWTSKAARQQALNRRQKALEEESIKRLQTDQTQFSFVINDNTVYTRYRQFRHPENRNRMKELLSLKRQQKLTDESLQKSRNYYADASTRERQQLSAEIIKAEEQQEMLQVRIRQLEKMIRNSENQ